jgi:hypothetical protein
LITLVLFLCLSPAVFTLAFLSRSVTADNVITFGSVKLKLHETYINEKGEEIVFDTGQLINVTSKAEQMRIVRVENVGEHPLFVRVSFAIDSVDADGKKFETADLMKVETHAQDWVYKDGYWYYLSVLYPNEKTKALMTEVIFDIDEITRFYPGSNYELTIDAQGVQSENNEADVLQVVGWPQE